MKDLDLKLDEVYTLKGNLDASRLQKQIEEFFKKKAHRSRANEYKPGSEKHQKCLADDEVYALIPDHKVRDTYSELTIGGASYSIYFITEEYHPYCYDDEGHGYYDTYQTLERDVMFLRRNKMYGELIYTFPELIASLEEEFVKAQEDKDYLGYFNWFEREEHMKPYKLIVDDIIRAKKKLLKVEFFKGGGMFSHNEEGDYVMLGDEKIMKSDIKVAWDLYESKEPIYDENDRKMEWPWIYSDGSGTTKWEFYKEHLLQKVE